VTPVGLVWPQRDERRLLGRFYLAGGIGELFDVIWPFQFAYLFMVMERPEWAVIPLLVESATALLAEIPTGAFADRFGRRRAVILGDVLSAAGLLLVPPAAQQSVRASGYGAWGRRWCRARVRRGWSTISPWPVAGI
jgi:MFS family permease